MISPAKNKKSFEDLSVVVDKTPLNISGPRIEIADGEERETYVIELRESGTIIDLTVPANYFNIKGLYSPQYYIQVGAVALECLATRDKLPDLEDSDQERVVRIDLYSKNLK